MEKKPIATLAICFYNQENFVNDAIDGALSQTYEDLEIILSDDCSTDKTYDRIIQKVSTYHGTKKVIVNRNECNMGLVPHIIKVLYELSSGKYIFLNGGDDISLPNRVSIGVECFNLDPDVTAVTFSRITINEKGEEIGKRCLEKDMLCRLCDDSYLSRTTFMAGADALSIDRRVLEFFGRMKPNCQTEDSVLRFRSLLVGNIYCSSYVGLKYRVHNNNISRKISNFETDKIADQYEYDLLCAKGIIDTKLYEKLKRKIDFYRRYRKMQEKKEQSNHRIKKKIIDVFLKLLYKLYTRKLKK